MGLREATILAVILGTTAIAAADKPAKRAPAKKPEPTKAQPAADPTNAEKPDSAAGAADGAADGESAARKEMPPHIVGPKTVDLGNSTVIDLPEGMVLFERVEAQKMLREDGEPADGVVAMVFKPGSHWHVLIDYEGGGYVDDSDADELDADDLLESYRQGTAEQNKTRKALGQPELLIDGWTEKPRYERGLHHLVWGLAGHYTGGKVVNFFTRILGRNGYASIDLIANPEEIEGAKKEAVSILGATHFKGGATYADHVSSDKSSGVGLRGLVLGGAGVAVASKLGLFAKLLLVFKKGFILLFAAIGGLFRWLFRRKPKTSDADMMAVQSPPLGPPPGDSPMGGPPTGWPPDNNNNG